MMMMMHMVTVSEADIVPMPGGHPGLVVIINDMMSACSHRASLLIVSDQAASSSHHRA
jgi:hypothetical protein